MRGQANFIENTPLILVMLLIAPVIVIHVYGILLVVGRFFHALHFMKADAPKWWRASGAIVSFLSSVTLSIGLIGHGFMQLFENKGKVLRRLSPLKFRRKKHEA